MAELVFVAFAALALVGLGCCGWHALGNPDRVAMLATGVVYGVVLEQLVILRFGAYRYNLDDAVLAVGDVPVTIGLGWAAIIYSGYRVARRFGVSARVRPLFVALFALHVDLAMDAVAIRVPFWTWTPPGIWFGVPLGNFVGWFLVAAAFVAAWDLLRPRLLARSRPDAGAARPSLGGASARLVLGTGTILLAVVGLVAGLEGWNAVATTTGSRVGLLGGAVLLSLALVARDGVETAPVDARVAAVPLLFHAFFLPLSLALGLHRTRPLVVVVAAAMAAVALALHRQGFERDGTGATVAD